MKARENTAVGPNLYTPQLQRTIVMSPEVQAAIMTHPAVIAAKSVADAEAAEAKAASKKKTLIIGSVIAVVVVGGGLIAYKATRD